MKILDKMERKFGRFGIPNLMLYLVIGNLLVYIFDIFFALKAGTTFSQYLYFSPALVTVSYTHLLLLNPISNYNKRFVLTPSSKKSLIYHNC